MNERIKQLTEHAIKSVDIVTGNELLDDELAKMYIPDCFVEKFTELIVKECADVCINENVSILDLNVIRESCKFTLQDLTTKSCGENLAKRIKEHFGVE